MEPDTTKIWTRSEVRVSFGKIIVESLGVDEAEVTDDASLIADLGAESTEVDGLVADLPAQRWSTPTPADGWTIAHQIAHLTWTDQASTLAIRDREGFTAHLVAALEDPGGFVDRGAEQLLDEPSVMLRRWREGRVALAEGLAGVPAGERIPWFATAMSPLSNALRLA